MTSFLRPRLDYPDYPQTLVINHFPFEIQFGTYDQEAEENNYVYIKSGQSRTYPFMPGNVYIKKRHSRHIFYFRERIHYRPRRIDVGVVTSSPKFGSRQSKGFKTDMSGIYLKNMINKFVNVHWNGNHIITLPPNPQINFVQPVYFDNYSQGISIGDKISFYVENQLLGTYQITNDQEVELYIGDMYISSD